ncbi:P-loop containing nucleoside triphosphate hydrolase protein [Trichoderma sp. SZMC 28015]
MAFSVDADPASDMGSKLMALEKRLEEMEKRYQSLLNTTKQNAKESEAKDRDSTEEQIDTINSERRPKIHSEEASPNTRVKIIKATKDPETGERIEHPDDSQKTKLDDRDNFAFILKKTVHNKFSTQEDTSEIDIVNLRLWDLLKEHLGSHPFHYFRGSPVTLFSPYEAIVYEWDTLVNAAAQPPKDDEDKQARGDLRILLDVISGGSCGDAKLDKYFKVRDLSLKESTVQFDDLWTIFPPGMLVYGKPFQGQDQVFVVRDIKTNWPELDDRPPQQYLPWRLDCWTYDWTGLKFQRTAFTLLFEPFEGHKPIKALPYYPFKLKVDEDKSIENVLIERGKRFRILCTAKEGSQLFEYSGQTIFGKKGFSGLGDDDDSDTRSRAMGLEFGHLARSRRGPMESAGVKSSFVNSRVMVDHLSYFQYGPPIGRNGDLEPSSGGADCMCADCQQNEGLAIKYRTRFDKTEVQGNEIWEDEQYMLCPPRVLGYVLEEKLWAQLQTTLVKDIPFDSKQDAWHNRLHLDDDGEKKELLFNLVRSHISETNQAKRTRDALEVDDIIPGKGKGLVILLYGPPGVGKTSTAETIALSTRKPLFSISVADVGTKAWRVESNLSRIFSLATTWQAILLIDEADVFLESRGRGGISTDRNALVSVFLRVLEYYQGIMFLTTNQIAQFDVAIPSRIHVSIQYNSLKPKQMKNIFSGFLDPLDDKGLVDNYKEIKEWLNDDVYDIGFDGRQIRNIVTASLGLARAEQKYNGGNGKLKKSHLKAIANNSRSFKTDFTVQYDRYINSQERLIR